MDCRLSNGDIAGNADCATNLFQLLQILYKPTRHRDAEGIIFYRCVFPFFLSSLSIIDIRRAVRGRSVTAELLVDSAFYPPWDGIMSTSQRAVMFCGWGVKAGMV